MSWFWYRVVVVAVGVLQYKVVFISLYKSVNGGGDGGWHDDTLLSFNQSKNHCFFMLYPLFICL